MNNHRADLYLVDDLEQALEVAADLQAEAIGFDVEGVLEHFYGNDPKAMPAFDGLHPNTHMVASAVASNSLSVPVGLMTNSTNHLMPSQSLGLVDLVANCIGGSKAPIPYVHKQMELEDGTLMGKKPDGTQGIELARRMDVNPARTVLIDDQGVKNFGEVANAGMQAIIVPTPIGFLDAEGRVIEHSVVMRFRHFEPTVYASLASRGPRMVARVAYRAIAGVPISNIREFHNLRKT